MSEQPNAETTETDATAENETTEQKPTETVEFWKQKAREQEKRAKENSKAAEKLAAIESENQTEAEKVAARIRELENEASTARLEALRFKVASKHGIDGDRAELLLTGSDEETMTRQAEALKQESDTRKKQGNHVPKEGASTNPSKDGDDREFVRNLFQSTE
jgi:predicted ribosome quality control (RQC) complex YloA/Tae2 family protein